MAGKLLRKAAVAQRYSVTHRDVERKVWRGLIPPPDYPFQSRTPFWNEERLDAHDKATVATARRPASDNDVAQLVRKISAARSPTEALNMFCEFRVSRSLGAEDVEKIVAVVRELKTAEDQPKPKRKDDRADAASRKSKRAELSI